MSADICAGMVLISKYHLPIQIPHLPHPPLHVHLSSFQYLNLLLTYPISLLFTIRAPPCRFLPLTHPPLHTSLRLRWSVSLPPTYPISLLVTIRAPPFRLLPLTNPPLHTSLCLRWSVSLCAGRFLSYLPLAVHTRYLP